MNLLLLCDHCNKVTFCIIQLLIASYLEELIIFSDDIMLVPSLLRFNEQDFPSLGSIFKSDFSTDNKVLFVFGYGCLMVRINATEEMKGTLQSSSGCFELFKHFMKSASKRCS